MNSKLCNSTCISIFIVAIRGMTSLQSIEHSKSVAAGKPTN